jgi:hypothetical protein
VPLPDTKRITHEFLIAGEGAGDQALFSYLCAAHEMTNYQCDNFGGIGNLESWLSGLPGLGGYEHLRLLIIVADNDDHPDERFIEVRRAIKKAKLPTPQSAFALKKEANKPAVFVVMLPFTPPATANRGCLETLLFESASANLPQYIPCVDQFCACVVSDAWLQRSHVDKLRLRILLSAACEDDPNLGLQYALNPAKNLIPLSHGSLDALVALLRDTPALL